ncbi:ArgE/DapE family deacylase [Modestobacter versicolor]|uniref:Acetylornithine deacetylase n=1 Tax=Modestobacter versicolor TaxID=429133 RepID=A0A323V8K9_9ACTN|nr:ArgE/DapE family deacylase [Modestobacter versicolor]MBB3675248.1 acetylornithine deacetylase [Modestobacter versicolor]PZA20901.1 peptidase M20 [Modestobacter versicolor]
MTSSPALPGTGLSTLEAAVLDAVDAPWLVDRLVTLVAVPSLGGTAAECEAQHLVAGWLDELGTDVDRWAIDLAEAAAAPDAPGQEVERSEAWGVVGTLPGRDDGQPALVLCGHTDVVPAGDPALWPGDPFTPRVDEGAVHGRGTCDMKGGLVAALAAVQALRTAGVRLARPLAVHSVLGEEDGGLGAWATLRRGHRGDACVIPEPTAGAVMTAHAGALTFRLTLTGLAAHAANRHLGVSTVELFEHVHAAIRSLEAGRQPTDRSRFGDHPFPYGLSIGRLRAGDWASTVPDRLVAEGRFGVRLGEPVDAARAAFEGCVAAACAAHPWLADHPAQVEWVGGTYASGRLPAGSPLLPAVQQAVTDAGGARPPERALTAGTDLRLYAAAGIPALHHGPGDLRLAHGPGEQVPVEDLLLSARSLALLALRTCGVA